MKRRPEGQMIDAEDARTVYRLILAGRMTPARRRRVQAELKRLEAQRRDVLEHVQDMRAGR